MLPPVILIDKISNTSVVVQRVAINFVVWIYQTINAKYKIYTLFDTGKYNTLETITLILDPVIYFIVCVFVFYLFEYVHITR